MKKEKNSDALKWIIKRSKSFIPMVILISFISAAVSLSATVMIWISKSVLDIATGDMQGSFLKYGLALVGVVLLQVAFSGMDSMLKAMASGKMTISLRDYLFTCICTKKYSQISRYHSGDLLNRLTTDINEIVTSVVNIIPNIVSMVTKIASGVAALIILDTRIAVIVVVLGVCVPAIGRMFNKKFKSLHKELQRTEGETRSFIQECFENTVVIKTFTSKKPFSNRLKSHMKENYIFKIKRTLLSVFTRLGLFSFFSIGYYVVLIWGAGQISRGAITYGMLTAFLQLISQLRAPLQNVSGIIPQYYASIASAERLMEIENYEDEIEALPEDKLELLKRDFSSLEFNKVNFAYENELVLKDCDFKLERGTITALTGESGSGKSTVFKLILGLYDPDSGNITVNGNTALDTSMRGLFAYVPQGNLVLSCTIRENMTLYNPDVTDREIEKAAKAAEIYDFISSLPEGFETKLSERGAGLSEGQIQRISIARALLVDAPILLLDEATSALDETTEAKVLGNIKKMKDKTVLFVTHRNTSLSVCDRIIHFDSKK